MNPNQFDFFEKDGAYIDQALGADETQVCIAIAGVEDDEGKRKKALAITCANIDYPITFRSNFSVEPEVDRSLMQFFRSDPDYGAAIIVNATIKKRSEKEDLIKLKKIVYDDLYVQNFVQNSPESSTRSTQSTAVELQEGYTNDNRTLIHKVLNPDDKLNAQTGLKIPEGTSHEVHFRMMIAMVENPDGKVIKGMTNEYLDSDYDYSGPFEISSEPEALDKIVSYFDSHKDCGDSVLINATITQNPNGSDRMHYNSVYIVPR